ncbi:MAG TPA: hypothetical protein VFP32_04065 [Candidatus Saccharimonadales bacterium]|nr:hypothetical protein [Candidatus Saccharimonadales bacterium]
MKDTLTLPYFTQAERSIDYLGQYKYLDIDGLDLDSPVGERLLLSEGIFVRGPKLAQLENLVVDGHKTVVLEPHPDDLALSASGRLMTSIAAGGVGKIINIFSKTAIDRFPWRDKITIAEDKFEELRLLESNLAVEEFLGQEFVSMKLPLASKRGYEEIFGQTHHDDALAREIGEFIANTSLEFGADTILSPLAVQGHIDHLVTFDAAIFAKRALGDQVSLVFYEDYPYSRNKNAYRRRIGQVAGSYALSSEYVAVDDYLNIMADMAIIYRSQFDDINRDQMLAIMREDFRAVALEAKAEDKDVGAECAQRYWRMNES